MKSNANILPGLVHYDPNFTALLMRVDVGCAHQIWLQWKKIMCQYRSRNIFLPTHLDDTSNYTVSV